MEHDDEHKPAVGRTALPYAVFGAVAACVIDGLVLPLAIGDGLMVSMRHPITLVPMGLFGAIIGGLAGTILAVGRGSRARGRPGRKTDGNEQTMIVDRCPHCGATDPALSARGFCLHCQLDVREPPSAPPAKRP